MMTACPLMLSATSLLLDLGLAEHALERVDDRLGVQHVAVDDGLPRQGRVAELDEP
jgi:hypothetical protein